MTHKPTHRPVTGCQDQLDRLAADVRAGGPITIDTSSGPLVCMTEAAHVLLCAAAGRAVHPLVTAAPDGVAGERGYVVNLTPREVQVLQAVAHGDSAATVASHYGLAENTVGQHLVSIRRKYRVHSTHEAVAAATADGSI